MCSELNKTENFDELNNEKIYLIWFFMKNQWFPNYHYGKILKFLKLDSAIQ